MEDITVEKILEFLRGRGVQESVIEEFEKQKIDGAALSKMNERHFENLGLTAMGDRLALMAFGGPKEENLDVKVERLKEALSYRGRRSLESDQRSAAPGDKGKKAVKPTLKVEFGWKHHNGTTFVQVKKGKGGGNRSTDMERSAHYEECLAKAKELFFPNLNSQLGKFKDMEAYMANYNGNQVDIEGFSIETYKKNTGMNLPRLYLMTKMKRRVQQKTLGATSAGSDSLSASEVQLSQQSNLQIPPELPTNFMQDDDHYQYTSTISDSSLLVATDESLTQSRVVWCCKQLSNMDEPQLTEPHIMAVVFPTKFIQSTTTKTFKTTAVVKDLYTWIGCFQTVPSHFSLVLDRGTILKDLSQPLCQIGKHIVVEALQIPPDVITGSKDLVCSELKSQCAICKEGLLPTDGCTT